MRAAEAGPGVARAALESLVERYDPDAIDLPGAGARIRLEVEGGDDAVAVITRRKARLAASDGAGCDAVLRADAATWTRMAKDIRAGMEAFKRGRLVVRKNLHIGIGFLAATAGTDEPGRLRFDSVDTSMGRIAYVEAGTGEPVMCLHGLGGTKASFMPTVADLAGDQFRIIAADLPGFGDSVKPIAAPYDAPWFARSAIALLDALDIERAHLIGNSMGGRVTIEAGFAHQDRVGRLALLSPAMAFLRERRWAPLVRVLRPELGLVQLAPSRVVDGVVRRLIPGAEDGWVAAGVDEFLRAYLNPRGRAAFYASARNIYLDEPYGEEGFWTRLATLSPETLFVWGRYDTLVPAAFMRYVERALPASKHVELECGHVPQLERPRETHAAIRRFFSR